MHPNRMQNPDNDAQLVAAAQLVPHAQRAPLLGHLRWCARTPYARLHMLLVNNEPMGFCTAVLLGATARIAHCVAHPAHHPALLIRHVQAFAAELEQLGARSVHLQCAPAEVPLWESIGFAVCDRFVQYGGGLFLEAQRDEVLLLEPVHTLALLHLDRKATGEERTPLLLEHRYAAQGYVEHGTLRGGLLPVLGHGYIVADAPEVGLELQRWLLPVQTHIIVPEANEAACAHLHERGYRVQGTSVRMVRGALPHFRPEMVFAWPW